MVNANNEMDGTNFSTTDCPNDSVINIPSMSQTPQIHGLRLLKYKSYYLKRKPKFIDVCHLQNGSSMVEDFCKLVCKPMTVRLTRLPDSELKKLTANVSPKTVPIRRTPIRRPLFKFYGYGKRKKNNTINGEECGKDCVPILTEIQSNNINKTVDNNANKTVHKNVYENATETDAKYVHSRKRLRVETAFRVQRSSRHKQCKKDLLRTVKQPIIILNRIDEVINKLAQSFAKVATNKQNHTVEQLAVTQNIAVTQTEDIGSTSTSKNDCSLNNQVADNYSEADSDDLSQLRFKSSRKRKLFSNSSDESDIDQLHTQTSTQANMLKLNTPQKENAGTSGKCNELRRVRRKTSKLNSLQNVTAKTANKHTNEEEVETGIVNGEVVKNNIVNLENKEIRVESDKVDVETASMEYNLDASENAVQVSTKNITGDSASSLLPTELSVVHNSREDTGSKPEDELDAAAGEMQQIKWKRSTSESGSTQYKLRKQAKILLVDLQHIKSSCGNKYLATEVEKLTLRNIDPLPNFNVICTTQNLLVPGVAYSENVAATSKPDNNNAESNVRSTESENIIGQKGVVGIEKLFNSVLKKDKLYKMMSDSAIGDPVSSHLPKQSTKELGLLNGIEGTSKTLLPSIQKSGHKSSTIKYQSKDVTFRNQKPDAKKTSPTKNEKLTEKKDSSKSKESSSNYKCIVCDLYFEEYSVLQQHLSKHTKQQLPSSKSKHSVSERCSTDKEILRPSPLTPERQTLPQSVTDKINCEVVPPSDSIADKNVSLHKKSQKLKSQKHKGGLSKKKVSRTPCKLTDECSVCFKEFPTREDLAAHIFLHTESELQIAYKAAKQKSSQQTEVAESETQVIEDAVANSADSVEKLSTNTNECETSSKAQTAQNQSEQTSKSAAVKVPEEVKEIDPKTSKPTHGKSGSNNHVTSVINNVEKAKTTKRSRSSKTSFTICQCHNRADVNFDYLKIEIVLLCHTCKVLFRSMECFETHYRLPEYSACNQNRPGSGRSPTLFCATCGMIFSSVQDVRQHLEMHIRFKKNCIIDFRCNICKVIFIGIGSLFHLHWAKHTRDSYWVASEQSFPKISLIDQKSRKEGATFEPGEYVIKKYVDNYSYVAEYVCVNCKLAFFNNDYLKTHLLNCKEDSLEKSQIVQSDATETRQLELRLICSLCQDASSSKVELYRHMKYRHKFCSEPQFMCTTPGTFICSICMAISENLIKFNEHWLSHCVKQPYFVCMYCNKDSDSVDAFKEHAKEHKLATRHNISCRVKYRNVKHVCNICNIGVESEKLLNEHSVIHNPNDLKLSNEEPDKENNATEKQAMECSKSDTERDKEKLISRLEDNEEEDSENELVIDLAEYPENESVVKDRPQEKKVPCTLPAAALPTTELNVVVDSGIETVPQNVFVNEDHLKTHLLNSKEDSLEKSQIAQSDATETRQLELHLICSLCQNASSSKAELYVHMKDKHKFCSEPQFVCVSLETTEETFICNICMVISEDVDKFNEHWMSHCVKQPYFVCTYCNKDSDSVDAFKVHAKEHKLATRHNISCRVKYRDVKHVCNICNVGVESEKLLNEHSIIHKSNDLMLSNEQPDKENNATEQQAMECSKSDTERDKEKLISILEGNEGEDSENELVIDLLEHPENESVVKDVPQEKKVPRMLPAVTLPVPTLPTTELNAAEDSKKDKDPIKEAEVTEPTKQKHGFLRVRALTELLEDTSNLFKCQVCKYSCESAEYLSQHYLTHIVNQKQPQPSQPGLPVEKKFISTGRTVQVPLLSRHYPGPVTKAKLIAPKPNPAVSSAAQASTKTAYHKNLPPCNIVRKIIVQRSAIKTYRNIPTTMGKDSSNAQTIQTVSTVDANSINRRESVINATNSNTDPSGDLPLTSNMITVDPNNYTYKTSSSHHPKSSRTHDLSKYSRNQYLRKVPGKNHNMGGVAAMGNGNVANDNQQYSQAQHDVQNQTHDLSKYSRNQYLRKVAGKNHKMGGVAAMGNGNVANDNQQYSQAQHDVQNQARMNSSASVYYQYPNSGHVYPGIDQGSMQSQQMMQQVPNHRIPRNPSPNYYYKNTTSGGMSIIINHTAPASSNVSTVDIRQQQGLQPRIHPEYTNQMVPADSQHYAQQSPQNTINYTGTGEVYQVSSNEYRGPISEHTTNRGKPIQSPVKLTCPYCPNSRTFDTRQSFDLHMNISHNFVCDLCGSLFYNMDDITIHKIKHGLMDT